MKSDPFAQLKLLEIQELDSKALQLRHAKANLPEVAQARAIAVERVGVENETRDARVVVLDLSSAQSKAETDVETVRARRRRDQERVDSGAISNPKDLAAMTAEIENLDRRIAVLEDEELEVMEALEAAQKVLDEHEAHLATYDQKIEALRTQHAEKVAALEAELAEVEGARPETVEGMPADLLALYDKIRESKGGVGAAELRARKCGGCGLTLDAAELSRVRSLQSNEVARCEECGRIMVRTAESGL
ncbi:C4-type zinc ribbon domain-containing protein [Nocardioides sp.]|uniref:zinc ribbon domain-containing protein n=1 Tax=Nocardioides sp. TaxID=35761 RepID=UPI002618D1D1|nr:C4-type zinc ribbon domain-containing protein [Nocardioides sp.]